MHHNEHLGEVRNAGRRQTPTIVTAVPINSSKLLKFHLYIIAFLVICSLTTTVVMVVMKTGRVEFFLLDGEANLPTFFSTVMLLEAAILIAVITTNAHTTGDRFRMHWTLLCVLFCLMAVDEAAQVHEKFAEPLRNLLGLGGLLTNAWVLPAFVFVLIAAIFFWRFIFSLEKPLPVLFIAAAAVYLSGVIGVEMVSGYFKSADGFSSLPFILSTTVEETLEMLGIALFIYALSIAVDLRNLALAVVERG